METMLARATSEFAALVFEGEAGIGKSTLWEAALALAEIRGFRVLAARPARAEAELPFGVFGDLFLAAPDDVLSAAPGAAAPCARGGAPPLRTREAPPSTSACSPSRLWACSGSSLPRAPLLARDRRRPVDRRELGGRPRVRSATSRRDARRGDPDRPLRRPTTPLELVAGFRGGVARAPARSAPLSLAALHRLFVAAPRPLVPAARPDQDRDRVRRQPVLCARDRRVLSRARARTSSPGSHSPFPTTLATLTGERIARASGPTRGRRSLAAAARSSRRSRRFRVRACADPEAALRPAVRRGRRLGRRRRVRFGHPLLAQAALDCSSTRRRSRASTCGSRGRRVVGGCARVISGRRRPSPTKRLPRRSSRRRRSARARGASSTPSRCTSARAGSRRPRRSRDGPRDPRR